MSDNNDHNTPPQERPEVIPSVFREEGRWNDVDGLTMEMIEESARNGTLSLELTAMNEQSPGLRLFNALAHVPGTEINDPSFGEETDLDGWGPAPLMFTDGGARLILTDQAGPIIAALRAAVRRMHVRATAAEARVRDLEARLIERGERLRGER